MFQTSRLHLGTKSIQICIYFNIHATIGSISTSLFGDYTILCAIFISFLLAHVAFNNPK